ncbi:MAG: glutamate--tRNA ligase [Clostridia bacterium]|nr:glutamate--tRNA ligase [Clostridia bacterium]
MTTDGTTVRGMTDYHVHTTFSDGSASPEETLKAALSRGMTEIGFSDHACLSIPQNWCMRPEQHLPYREEITRLKKAYRGKIRVLCGIEQDYYTEIPAEGYDYIIGSVHYVFAGGEYCSVDNSKAEQIRAVETCFGGDFYAFAEAYYELVADVAEKTRCHLIGHFDLISKFNGDGQLFDENHPRYRSAWMRAADRLLATGIPFECNFGAISRGYRQEPYPSRPIREYLCAHGARFVLTGDAHSPEAVGFRGTDSGVPDSLPIAENWIPPREDYDEKESQNVKDIEMSEVLFPNVTMTPQELEEKYPPRNLPEGAKVTRFAPSPTGFVHFGGLFPATVCERLAHQSGGVFYLRIEDTDAKREVPGAKEALIRTLSHYGIRFDEGAAEGGEIGEYGPYTQSQRREIYHVFAKKLVAEGHAYPVFTTEEELAALNAVNKKEEIQARDWHEDDTELKEQTEKNRSITVEEAREHLSKGHPFVLRMRADGDPEKKIRFTDLVKGDLEIPENDRDEVLLKSDGIPSYHFAHAVDDHLMRTTHVVRGEEWLPSLARHLMLFRFLGFRPPKYLHISQLMQLKEDEEGKLVKKKLSKRDLGANLDDYEALGFDPLCVIEYVMTLLNSNYEEWHAANPDLPYTAFPFSLKKMSASGCLFDYKKLSDVSRNVVARMSAEEVREKVLSWAERFDPSFAACLSADPEKALAVFAIGRGGKKPRKDYGTWKEAKEAVSFFYADYYVRDEEPLARFEKADVAESCEAFLRTYSPADEMNVWFDKIKVITESIGFASDMKAYKAEPERYRGNVADVSMFLRIAVTGRENAPDLYTVMQILGEAETRRRIRALAESARGAENG